MYSLKYSGIDNPRKRETPVMKRFLIEFMFVNCRNDNPTEAGNKRDVRQMGKIERDMQNDAFRSGGKEFLLRILTNKTKQDTVYSSEYWERN